MKFKNLFLTGICAFVASTQMIAMELQEQPKPPIKIRTQDGQKVETLFYDIYRHFKMFNDIADMQDDANLIVLTDEQFKSFDLLFSHMQQIKDLAYSNKPEETRKNVIAQLEALSMKELELLLDTANEFGAEQFLACLCIVASKKLDSPEALAHFIKNDGIALNVPSEVGNQVVREVAEKDSACFYWLLKATQLSNKAPMEALKNINLRNGPQVQQMLCSPNGKYAVICFKEVGFPVLVDLERQTIKTIEHVKPMGHPMLASYYAMCPYIISWNLDGSRLAIATVLDLKIWDVETVQCIYRASISAISSMAWKSNIQLVFQNSRNAQCQLSLLDLETVTQLIIPGVREACTFLWNAMGTHLTVGLWGQILILDGATWQPIFTLQDEEGRIPKIAWSANGKKCAIAHGQKRPQLTIYNIETNNSIRFDTKLLVETILWHPNNNYLLIFNEDADLETTYDAQKNMRTVRCKETGVVTLWNTETNKPVFCSPSIKPLWCDNSTMICYDKRAGELFTYRWFDAQAKRDLVKTITPEQLLVLRHLYEHAILHKPLTIDLKIIKYVLSSLDPVLITAIEKEIAALAPPVTMYEYAGLAVEAAIMAGLNLLG